MSALVRRVARKRGQRRDRREQEKRVMKQVVTYSMVLTDRYREKASERTGKTRSARKRLRRKEGRTWTRPR